MQRIFVFILICLLQFPSFSGIASAGDSTSFNPVPITVVAKGAGGVPVGTIIAWPVAQNPADMENWLECNGQSISASVYPELVALVGGRVPDFRGLFLRRHGAQTSSHYGFVTHQGAALGQLQGDTISNITGRITVGNQYANAGVKYPEGALKVRRSWGGNDYKESGNNSSPDEIQLDASGSVPTAEENRPVNRAVRYLVRALP